MKESGVGHVTDTVKWAQAGGVTIWPKAPFKPPNGGQDFSHDKSGGHMTCIFIVRDVLIFEMKLCHNERCARHCITEPCHFPPRFLSICIYCVSLQLPHAYSSSPLPFPL
jgi:hypothetical protein